MKKKVIICSIILLVLVSLGFVGLKFKSWNEEQEEKANIEKHNEEVVRLWKEHRELLDSTPEIEIVALKDENCVNEYEEIYATDDVLVNSYCTSEVKYMHNGVYIPLKQALEEGILDINVVFEDLYKKYEDTPYSWDWLDGGSRSILAKDFYIKHCHQMHANDDSLKNYVITYSYEYDGYTPELTCGFIATGTEN